ncbi:MAG TPA: hypothetical protein VFB58_00855 [Chloroflexota bacterium]|nr:hypothetical protein [Chloroflexota bacterium]
MKVEREWGRMRLGQAHPYWVLGLLPEEHIDGIAYNEMLDGGEGDALAVLAGGGLEADEIARLTSEALAAAGIGGMVRTAGLRAVFRNILDDMIAGHLRPLVGATILSELDPEGEVPELQGPFFSGLADEAEGFARLRPEDWQSEGPIPAPADGEADILRLAQEVRAALDNHDEGEG